MDIDAFLSALMFQAGYNTTIVAIGALFLGLAGGMVGTFLLLRRRSLVSDALSHATLPGVGIAFLAMAALGGTGRFLPGLLLGAALSAFAGLAVVEWLTRRTRLNADAAIGAVLSSFFGFGVVLLTVIQSAQIGQQAGIGSFLLGSTSGMLRSEALMLAALAVASAIAIFWMRRVFVLISFDETFASSTGIDIRRADLILMLLVLAVTVTGLRIVGLVLVIALLIIPPVAARFWTEKVDRMMLISGVIGAAAGFVGTALSASIPNLPTGPIMVLVATTIFTVSMFFAPRRGVLSNLYRARALFQESPPAPGPSRPPSRRDDLRPADAAGACGGGLHPPRRPADPRRPTGGKARCRGRGALDALPQRQPGFAEPHGGHAARPAGQASWRR
jgi:manganese/zinc/iron transport system permease protein